MTLGCIFIAVSVGEYDQFNDDLRDGKVPDPYRTGGWAVVSDNGVRQALEKYPSIADTIIKQRWSIIETDIWSAMELPHPTLLKESAK